MNKNVSFLITSLIIISACFPIGLPANTIRPLNDLGTLTAGIVDIKDNDLRLVAGILVTTGILFLNDQPLLKTVTSLKSPGADVLFGTAQYFGDGRFVCGVGGTMLLGGLIANNKHMKTLGTDIFEGFAFSGLYVTAVKFIAGRARPYTDRGPDYFKMFSLSDDFASFYSGHSTEAFTLASIFAHYFQSPVAGFIAYSLASLTGIQRIYDSKHWPSDVFLGAAIGILIGRHIVRKNGTFKDISIDPTGFKISFAFNGP